MLHHCGAGGADFFSLARREAARQLGSLLLQDGYEVEGDENVFVTPDGLITRPRGMRVKELTGTLVPGLSGVLQAAPCYQDTFG